MCVRVEGERVIKGGAKEGDEMGRVRGGWGT